MLETTENNYLDLNPDLDKADLIVPKLSLQSSSLFFFNKTVFMKKLQTPIANCSAIREFLILRLGADEQEKLRLL